MPPAAPPGHRVDHFSEGIWRSSRRIPHHASLQGRSRGTRPNENTNTYMDTYFSEFPLPLKAALLVLAHLLVAGLLKAGFFFAGGGAATEPDATVWPVDAQALDC